MFSRKRYSCSVRRVFVGAVFGVIILGVLWNIATEGTILDGGSNVSVQAHSWIRWKTQKMSYPEHLQDETDLTPDRLDEAKKVCRVSPPKTPWRQRGYLHNTLPIYYCKIPKVASTFMEAFLPKLFLTSTIETAFSVIEDTKQDESIRIKNSFSYVFVREPYSRLFSAYENKLFLPNKFFDFLGKDIIKTVRKPPTSLSTGHDVTFAEMLEYVVTKYNRGEALNEHLEPMHDRCDPCTVQFNFIGKLETMGPDIETLVDAWNKSEFINKSDIEGNAREIESETRSAQLFGPVGHLFKIANGKLKIDRKDLFLRTWSSYQIRGVVLKHYEMPFINDTNTINKEQYQEALTTAIEKSKDRKDELKMQREEALLQAYRTVPLNLMQKLRTFVKRDCDLFGYDNTPDKLFSRNMNISNTFNYFKGLRIS